MKIFILLILCLFVKLNFGFGQLSNDSNNHQPAVQTNITDTTLLAFNVQPKNYQELLKELLNKHKYINISQSPFLYNHNKKQASGKEFTFYLISSIILLFGFFKVFYSKYFNNIFRVFLNTSLRQNQLTDILMQSKLPSLIFNIFFAFISGLYIWLLLDYFKLITKASNTLLIFCVLAVGIIYIIKFCVIKFIGWVTDMSDAADTYVFVMFLINKIIGVLLIPFVILIAFASLPWIKGIFIFSFLLVGLLFLLRFFRTYGLLQHHLNISRIHFLIYLIAIELLPLFIIYKLSLTLLFS